MAQCKWCNKSGWFMFLDHTGLCNQCSKIIRFEAQQRIKLVTDSVKIVNNSKNLDTRLSRLELIYENANMLYKFEQRGISIFKDKPSAVLEQLRGKKDQIILEGMRIAVDEAEKKSAEAKTIKAKITPMAKVLSNIALYKEKLDDKNTLSPLEQRVKNKIQIFQNSNWSNSSENENRNKVEQQVIEYIEKRMFNDASMAVASYEAKQVFSRGMGIDWNHYDPKRQTEILNSIFNNKPEILSKLEDAKLESLRIGAAMMELWGDNSASKWLPPNFETGLSIDNDSAARMLLFNSQHEETLKGYAESGVDQYVEILATPDSCESCKKLEGKRYELDKAPKLPNPNCTHEMGCRCVYLPCVD
jgi:hypothetical protein